MMIDGEEVTPREQVMLRILAAYDELNIAIQVAELGMRERLTAVLDKLDEVYLELDPCL